MKDYDDVIQYIECEVLKMIIFIKWMLLKLKDYILNSKIKEVKGQSN